MKLRFKQACQQGNYYSWNPVLDKFLKLDKLQVFPTLEHLATGLLSLKHLVESFNSLLLQKS